MIRTVEQVSRKIYHRESCKNAFLHGFQKSLFDCRIEAFRHTAANDALRKGQALGFAGRERDLDMPVLTAAARLLLVLALDLYALLDGLAVRNARFHKLHACTIARL